MKKRILTLLTALALVLGMLSGTAMAATITPSVTSVELAANETTVSFVVSIREDANFAGAEFGLKPASSDVQFVALTFLDSVSGESVVQTVKDGTLYFGFFAGSNKFAGSYDVARVTYSYSGKTPTSIDLVYSQVVTIDANGNTVSDETSDTFSVTLTRKADTGGTTPVGPSVPSNPGSGSTTPAGPLFDDVFESDYYYDAVYWAVKNNVTTGTSENKFSPARTCTRAEAITFLWRIAKTPKPTTYNCPFTDVAKDAYYYDAMLWGLENGIIQGTSPTTFSPNAQITRSQFVTFLWRYAKWPDPTTTVSPFTDVSVPGYYYYNAVLWAVENEVTIGTSENTFSPDNSCSRAQVVTFLYRYFGK